ncbi:MAG: DinB family protein [Syntrophomonadaceae bacterium]
MNTRVNYYVRQLRQVYEGENWNGESYVEKLKSVNEQGAFLQPYPGNHSVAELLWHCIYWRTVILKRLQGDNEFQKGTEKEQNFLPLHDLKKKGWSELLAELSRTQEELVNFLNTKTDEFLDAEYVQGLTNEYNVEGVVQHDHYHLGQMGLVISILKKKEEFEPWIQ